MEKEIKILVTKYIKEGYSIDKINETFIEVSNKVVHKKTEKTKTKKTRKKKKICRPVLFISDSSADES